MKTLLRLVMLGLIALQPVVAQTAKSRADLYAEIDAELPSNSAGAITAAKLRSVFKNTVASADNGLTDGTGVTTTGTYADPAWITSLSFDKITALPTTLSGYGITDAQPAGALKSDAVIAGRKILWLGDSITDGSSSTNTSVFSFRAMAPKIIGSEFLARFGALAAVNGGVPGDTAAQALARLPALISAHSPQLCHVQLGTNASSSLAQYQADMRAIFDVLRAASIPYTVGLVPPRGASADAASIERTHVYNLWLRNECARQGVPVADTYAALVDSNAAAGTMLAAYDAGDGVHPNNAGHLAMAQRVVDALEQLNPGLPAFVAAPGAPGLVPNVLQSATTGWTAANSGSGTGWSSSISVEAPASDDVLTAGQWFRLAVTNASGSSKTHTRYLGLSPMPAAGDVLLIAYALKQSDGATPGGAVKVEMANGTTVFSVLTESFGVAKPGRYLDVATVPASPSAIRLRLTVTAADGETNVGYLGQVQVWNLTALGMSGEF